MLLKSLRLVNFGTVKKALILFENSGVPAIYVFSGDNGSGKSTIVKALSLLLINWCKGKLSDYINWNEDFFEIECTFSHLGKEFISFLRYDGGSNRKLTIKEGEKTESFTNTAAVEHLKSYFDPKLFRASAFSFEGEIDVIETSPAERRESLKKIHDVEFKEEIARAEKELNPLKDQLAKLDTDISVLDGKSYQDMEIPKLPFSKEVMEQKKASLIAIDSALQQSMVVNNEIDRKQNEAVSLPVLITDFDEQKRRMNETRSKKVTEESTLDASRVLTKKELDHIEETIDIQFSEEREQRENELSDAKTLLGEKRLVRLPPAPSPSIIENLVAEIARKKSQIEEIDSTIQILGTGVCPTCGKPVEECEIEQSSEKKKDLQASLLTAESELVAARAEKTSYDEQTKLNDLIRAEQTLISTDIKLLNAAIATLGARKEAELKSERDRLTAEVTLIDTKISSVHRELDSYKALIDSLDKSKKESSDRLLEVQEFLKTARKIDVTQQQAEKKTLSEEISNFSVTLGQIDQAKQLNASIELQKTEDKKTRVELQKKKDVLLHKIQVAEKAVEIIKRDLPNFIISKLILTITESMNDFLKQTYKGRYRVQVLESKNALEVVYGPKNTDVSLSSGYERQVINSAYKYAKEKMLGMGFLILDEVDSAASDANSKVFYQTLGELPYHQLLVITHKPSTKDLLSQDYGATVFACQDGEIRS